MLLSNSFKLSVIIFIATAFLVLAEKTTEKTCPQDKKTKHPYCAYGIDGDDGGVKYSLMPNPMYQDCMTMKFLDKGTGEDLLCCDKEFKMKNGKIIIKDSYVTKGRCVGPF